MLLLKALCKQIKQNKDKKTKKQNKQKHIQTTLEIETI